jgi:hypothetical protein
MVHRLTNIYKLRSVDTRGQDHCSDASLWTCEKSIKQWATQQLLPWMALGQWSPFPLNFHQNLNALAVCLPHAPLGCVSKPAKLDEKQRQQVEHLRKGHRDLDTTYQLSQAFVLMLAERQDTDLDGWYKPNAVALPNLKALRKAFVAIMLL